MSRRRLFIAGCGWLCGLLPACANPTSVALAWDPSACPNLAGYNLYWGPSSGIYTNSTSTGTNSQYTLTGLNPGSKYYLTVTAVNVFGLESVPSSELAYAAPQLKLMVAPDGSGDPNRLRIAADVMDRWTLETSTDLQRWSAVASGTNSGVDVSITNALEPARYFRLQAL
ncbi:MAG: fibronectin type III domain-containing protein [Verrucomicrobiota bacterium]